MKVLEKWSLVGLSFVLLGTASALLGKVVPAFEGEKLNVSVAWVLMTTAALGSLAIYVRLKMMETEEAKKETEKEEQITLEELNEPVKKQSKDTHASIPIRFEHPDFDFVLENVEKDIPFLQQHQDILGLEALHQVEKLYRDLQQSAIHYQHTDGMYKKQAEAPIENLCMQAETVAEELKERVQAYHVQQIEKLNYIHTK